MMSDVKRVHTDRINVYRQRPAKATPSRKSPEQAENDFTRLSYRQQSVLTDTFFDHGIRRRLRRKITQGQLPVDDCLDLHGCTQKKAYSELSGFLQQAISAGYRMVIVIHGKGLRSQESAILKPLALHWLSEQNSVLGWCPAQPVDGGHGASYVYLR